MKGDAKDKSGPDPDRAGDPRRRYEPDGALAPINDAMLRDYLADALAAEQSARVEKALRDSAELRAQLENVRQNRADGQLHTLGAIWRRSRMTCPSRQQLGSFLLDALDPELAAYLTFHLDVIECPFCQANLDDLKAQSQAAVGGSAKSRQRRIFQASQPLLGEDGRG